jgi:hypothetical protein
MEKSRVFVFCESRVGGMREFFFPEFERGKEFLQVNLSPSLKSTTHSGTHTITKHLYRGD